MRILAGMYAEHSGQTLFSHQFRRISIPRYASTNLDDFDNIVLVGIFPGVPDMNEKTTEYQSGSEIQEKEKLLHQEKGCLFL